MCKTVLFLYRMEKQQNTHMMERAEFEREMKHLRLQLIEKDNELNCLFDDKK